ncbi:MAG: ABC transporter ATP-binding protein [Thermoleophilia bacterium]
MSLLHVDGVDAHYGELQALHGIQLRVEQGETLGIIGANGAGKSTLLNVIAGLETCTAGRILLDGTELQELPAHQRVGLGVALVPEGRHVFPSLSVRENLQVGAHLRRPGPWTVEKVFELLPLLVKRADYSAGLLSGGEQQALAIGRGLMSNPALLLLDEVSLGLAPIVVREFYGALAAIVAEGITVVVVEQDIGQVMRVADTVTCFLEGRVVLSGRPADLRREQITKAYFGM